MRDLRELNAYRVVDSMFPPDNANEGAFIIDHLRIIGTTDRGWDHVSVSCEDRCPTWEEMERVAKLFFKENETAVQYHVPQEDHVNYHLYCLHWWRPQRHKLYRPDKALVGGSL